jgi:hypothetical protein
MCLVEVKSVSLEPPVRILRSNDPRTGACRTVESFLGSVDVFHSVNAALPQRQGAVW